MNRYPGLKIFTIILFPFVVGIALPQPEMHSNTGFIEIINPEHLDGPFTGGFGEQTCHSCHFDYDINMDGGRLVLEGIGQTGVFHPGQEYKITVTVESDHLEIGGFQMTSRYEDGTQAGTFGWEGERLMLTPSISDEVQYIQHSRQGTSPTGGRNVSWTFTWEAPAEADAPVIFNVAANAGNDDDSAFGDRIYVKEKTLSPVR